MKETFENVGAEKKYLDWIADYEKTKEEPDPQVKGQDQDSSSVGRKAS